MALIGAGKVAADLHVPTIGRSPHFECVCTISPHSRIESVPSFMTLDDALAEVPIDAVAICTPPQVRREIALDCIARGLHVLLEKPPADALAPAIEIRDAAEAAGVVAFAGWHSQFAARLETAKRWLAGKTLAGGSITWREDVFKWHPGQNWLWEEGGFGVFDPGINALSMLTELVDMPVSVEAAHFDVPENVASPVAARLTLRLGSIVFPADFSFLEKKGDVWSLNLQDSNGELFNIEHGGSDDPEGGILDGEYMRMYERFGALLDAGRSEFDLRPLEIVAEAFAAATIKRVAPIEI
jgi:D-galactose 1-dehydrogenase